MGGLFSKPKTVKAPPVSEPEPVPVESTEDAKRDEARKRRRRGGKKATVITGELTPEVVGKKTLG